MNCYNCESNIGYKKTTLCKQCTFDPNIVISTTEAKILYKLTNEEINNANLFKITFKVRGNIGTKYLRKDIRDLAVKLSKKLPFDNQQKQSQLLNKKTELINFIKDLLKKINYGNEYNFLGDNTIISIMNKYVEEDYESIVATSMYIVNIIEHKIIANMDQILRKKEINKKINLVIKKEYLNHALTHPNCEKYIKDGGDMDKCLSLIKIDIINIIKKDERKREINKELNLIIEKEYLDLALIHPYCTMYIEHGNNIDYYLNLIETYIVSIARRDEREYEIKMFVEDNNYDKIYVMSLKFVQDFVKKAGKIKSVKKKIIKSMQDKKKIDELLNLFDDEYKTYIDNDMATYKTYIINNPVDDVYKKLKTDISKIINRRQCVDIFDEWTRKYFKQHIDYDVYQKLREYEICKEYIEYGNMTISELDMGLFNHLNDKTLDAKTARHNRILLLRMKLGGKIIPIPKYMTYIVNGLDGVNARYETKYKNVDEMIGSKLV